MRRIIRRLGASCIWLLLALMVWSVFFGGCQQDEHDGPVSPVDPTDTADTANPCDTCQQPDTCEGDTCDSSDTTDVQTVDTLAQTDACPPLPPWDTVECGYSGPLVFDIVAVELLRSPAYSRHDGCVYYVDTGMDSLYYANFLHSDGNVRAGLTVQPGLYRLRLNDDSPAELVAPWGISPTISGNDSTLYYIDSYIEALDFGSNAGSIWKMKIPDGEPELVYDRNSMSVCWLAPDTLVVDGYILNLRTMTLSDQRVEPSTELGCLRCGCSPDRTEYISFIWDGIASQIRVTDLNGHERILALGGGVAYPCRGWLCDPSYALDGEYIVYIQTTIPTKHRYLYPCSWNDNPAHDGQIWIMSAVDGSSKRQVSTWSRIRP